MRRFWSYILVLFLLVWSCEKDPIASPGQKQQAVRYDAAAELLTGLLDRDISPDEIKDYVGGKWEVSYGQPLDEEPAFERAVVVNSAAAAESAFCGLTGWREDILETTGDGYRVDLSSIGLGTLEFFRTPDGNNLGYAVVSIPCIPRLQRITYMTEEQIGDNGVQRYQSPCLYGDVYLHNGRYYICTREATGYTTDSSGILVCMEAGRGTNFSYHLSDETWGCWKPKQNWSAGDIIDSYLLLCADPEFAQDKARIVKKWPGKVFPLPQRWSSYEKQETIGDVTWGFGAAEPGYSHVTRFQDNFADEKSNSDKRYADWKGIRVVVIRDATEGNYSWGSARWYRRCHHYVLPWVCKYDKGIFSSTHMYTSKSEWNDFFWDNPIVYTLNAIRFYEEAPAGYELQTVWE